MHCSWGVKAGWLVPLWINLWVKLCDPLLTHAILSTLVEVSSHVKDPYKCPVFAFFFNNLTIMCSLLCIQHIVCTINRIVRLCYCHLLCTLVTNLVLFRLCNTPRGAGYPLSAFAPPLSIHFLIFCSLLLFPFLLFSFTTYFLLLSIWSLYQNRPTPFLGVRS